MNICFRCSAHGFVPVARSVLKTRRMGGSKIPAVLFFINVRKVAFRGVKGGKTRCKRPPFTMRNTAFCSVVCKCLIYR